MSTSIDLPLPATGASKACRGAVAMPSAPAWSGRATSPPRDLFALEIEGVEQESNRSFAATTSAHVGLSAIAGNLAPRGS